MPRNRMLLTVLASFSSLNLGGCYFASGIEYDEPAFRHPANQEHPIIIELRTRPWHTGNSHIPFDFTVYHYDETFELVLPSEIGTFNKNDIALKGCGLPLMVVAGSVDVTRDMIKFDIEYGIRNASNLKPKHLVGSMRLFDASTPPKRCVKPYY